MKRLFLFVFILIVFVNAKALVIGDINNDGKVSSLDYILLKNHILGKSELITDRLARADVNNDKKISSLDYITIKKIIINGKEQQSVSISLDKENINLEIGKSNTLKVTTNSTDKNIAWTSSNTSIATVSGGVVKAIKEGTVTITAKTREGVSATCKVTVLTRESKYCEELVATGVKSLDYKSFINKFPNSDDYYAIKATHDCANKHKLPVKVTKGEYNIYNKTTEAIIVKTSTDLSNSTIYIHEEKGIVYKKTPYTGPIYRINHDKCKTVKTKLNNLKEGNTIKELAGSPTGKMVIVTDLTDTRKVFIRFGGNANNGTNPSDAFRVDKNGKILDPLFWNYDNKNIEVYTCDIPEEKLVFKNANIYNIVATDVSASTRFGENNTGQYINRGIRITRSNTVVDNIKHAYILPSKSKVSKLTYAHSGAIYVQNAANVVVQNSKVYAYECNGSNSTYDLAFNKAVNLLIKNVTMYDYGGNSSYDYDKYSSYFSKDSSQIKDHLWGVNVSFGCKNVTYDGCVLNRIDAHEGIYNLTVKNTRIGRWAMTLIGYGKLNLDHVAVYNNNHFISFRTDYGSLWNGTVNIKDCWIHPGNNDTVTLITFKISYDDNGYVHNFGYDLSLPKVNVNGFKVFNNVSKLYIFNNSDDQTGKVKGNLKKISNYIKNNKFSYYYPKKSDIKVSNVSNKNGSIKSVNYYNNFGEN